MRIEQPTKCSKDCGFITRPIVDIKIADGDCYIKHVVADTVMIGKLTIPKHSMAFVSAFVDAIPDNNSGIVSFKVFMGDEKDGSRVFTAIDGVSKITNSSISISHVCKTDDNDLELYLFAKNGSNATITPVNFRALYIQDLT